MPDQPRPEDAQAAGKAAESGWRPWTPGVRLMQRLSTGARLALLLGLALLPLLPWVWPSLRPGDMPHAWMLALVVALYGWFCAVLASRRIGQTAVFATAVESRSSVPATDPSAPALSQALEAGAASEASEAVAPNAAPPSLPDPQAGPAMSAPPSDVPASMAGQTAAVSPSPAGWQLAGVEIRGVSDEIARRVVSSSGLLDACAKSAAEAMGDIDAVRDEDRHAQKLLSAMRTRMLQLDQRCHALVQGVAQASSDADGAGLLAAHLQAVEASVLHIHQLAERLSAAERGHGMRMESLRRSVERVDMCSERGLRESQQLMHLTRRITATLDEVVRDQPRAGAPDATADG